MFKTQVLLGNTNKPISCDAPPLAAGHRIFFFHLFLMLRAVFCGRKSIKNLQISKSRCFLPSSAGRKASKICKSPNPDAFSRLLRAEKHQKFANLQIPMLSAVFCGRKSIKNLQISKSRCFLPPSSAGKSIKNLQISKSRCIRSSPAGEKASKTRKSSNPDAKSKKQKGNYYEPER